MEQFVKFERVTMNEAKIREDNVQSLIAQDPSILGLGELYLVERERKQKEGGRLDILLKDSNDSIRYEVEVQLGATDPSHIIRTLEYWDVERKRNPQYQHCAVIVAEDITSRFFNVISLFNGFIPIIAIQMDAYKVPNSDKLGIVFTKILDQSSLISDDDKTQETTDKRFWEAKKLTTFAMVDDVLPIINDGKENKYELNYTKVYISVKRDQSPMSIIAFEPQQQFLLTKFKINQNPDVDRLIDNAHFSAVLPYDPSFKNYRIKLSKQDVESNEKK